MPATALNTIAASPAAARKPSLVPEKKYKCQFCNRAFSRSEHRSRHERSRKSPSPLITHGGCGAIETCTNRFSQTPKNVLSNAQNAEALLFAEICYFGTTGRFTPRMAGSHCTAMSSVGKHLPSQVLPSILSRSKPAVMA